MITLPTHAWCKDLAGLLIFAGLSVVNPRVVLNSASSILHEITSWCRYDLIPDYICPTPTAVFTPTPTLAPTPTFTPTPDAADTVAITRAEFDARKSQLRVEATGSDPSATLKVYVASSGSLIGTLSGSGNGRYRGQFSWPANPGSVTVRSSSGGSDTSQVALK